VLIRTARQQHVVHSPRMLRTVRYTNIKNIDAEERFLRCSIGAHTLERRVSQSPASCDEAVPPYKVVTVLVAFGGQGLFLMVQACNCVCQLNYRP
jgi:hypothetical protein